MPTNRESALQGWWSVESAVDPNGKRYKTNETKSWKMFVEDTDVKWYGQPMDQPEFHAEFSLDTREDPHTISFKELIGPNSVDAENRLRGIYDFNDDTCTRMILVFSRDPNMERPVVEDLAATSLTRSFTGYLVLELEKVD